VLKRLNGIDSIRIICALVVTFSHFGLPPLFTDIAEGNKSLYIIEGLFNNLSPGPAAVIVFFVISGLCINFPYSNGKGINYLEYYGKRYIRIGIPMLVAVVISIFLKISLDNILWSLYAEIIYYTIFPILIWVKNKIGWRFLIVLSFVISYLVVFLNTSSEYDGNYIKFGNAYTWLLGLPCWLLGAKLAEGIEEIIYKPVLFMNLLIYRFSIWGVAILCSILRFHFSIGYYLTLNIFSIAVFFWLSKEISYYSKMRSNYYLESSGKGSYSLYLCHLFALPILSIMHIHVQGTIMNWIILFLFTLIISYVFYALIERPSHSIANKFSYWWFNRIPFFQSLK
jgi:peptidoglycan/LPS O-acetylase OafA/YrhL